MDILTQLIGVIASVLGKKPEEIKKEDHLTDVLKLDELDGVELIMTLEELFDIEISDENAEKFTTVESIATHIATLKSESGHEVV